VAEAHEGFGLPVGCNTPAGGYGPSQDEKPWGRGLRALLERELTDLRVRLFSRRSVVLPVFGLAGALCGPTARTGLPVRPRDSAGVT
jgi:hypothetical protein